MQNKPNLLNAQMNVSKVLTKDYENERLGGRFKNKANTKPNKPNLSRRSLWRSRIKPNLSRRSLWRSRTNPISKLWAQYMVYCPAFPDSLLRAAFA